MAPKQAPYDELRAMGSITTVGVTLKMCNINYNCSQLDYGQTCNFLGVFKNKTDRHHSFMTQLLLSKLHSGYKTVSHIFPYFSFITYP